MKKLMSILLLTLLLFSSFTATQSMAEPTIKVTVNGELVSFPVDPTIIDNTTMVPMREIFDALGASVVWNGATRSVTGERAGVKVQLTLNNKNATRNGSILPLKVPAQLVNGKTMVPTKFIAEALGATVAWDGATKTVIITDDFKEAESNPIEVTNDIGEEVMITDYFKVVQIIDIDKGDEIVTIKNTGDKAVSLKGWRLVSHKGDQEFFFPDIELKANSTIYITSGAKAKEDGIEYYKWTGSYIWNNNESDPGSLYDSNDNLISHWPR